MKKKIIDLTPEEVFQLCGKNKRGGCYHCPLYFEGSSLCKALASRRVKLKDKLDQKVDVD